MIGLFKRKIVYGMIATFYEDRRSKISEENTRKRQKGTGAIRIYRPTLREDDYLIKELLNKYFHFYAFQILTYQRICIVSEITNNRA